MEDYQSLKETAYLLRSPANARRLLASIEELENGGGRPGCRPYGSRRTGSEDHLRLPGLGGLPVAASPGPKEPLKHGFQGYWSRRINDEHRLIHKVTDDSILIAQCRYHYEN